MGCIERLRGKFAGGNVYTNFFCIGCGDSIGDFQCVCFFCFLVFSVIYLCFHNSVSECIIHNI